MKNKKHFKSKNADFAANGVILKKAKKITIIAIFAVMISVCASACGVKNGADGVDGKNGKDGVATSVALSDGKVTLDEKSTRFDGETLSAPINLSVSGSKGGKVSGGGRYPINTAVLVSAKPDEGYVFSHWQNENGEAVGNSSAFLTRATSAAQNYVAVFEVDKAKAYINVFVRADKSLPESAIIEGGGRFAYGDEYVLRVTDRGGVLNTGTVLFYEVTEERFKDENFAVSVKDEACSRGQTAVFNVDGLTDKYYLAAFIDQMDIGVSIDFNIKIEAACNVEVKTSNGFYGTASVTKINGKNVEKDSYGGLPNIWAGDAVTVSAKPTAVNKFDGAYYDFEKVARSEFIGWVDEVSGETVSAEKEYTFVAKKNVTLKAVFAPKTVLCFEANGVTPEIITKNGVISQSSYFKDYNGALTNFYAGEEILIHANFASPLSKADYERFDKFVWLISYDNVTWKTLSYSREAYLKIPENTTVVYLKATFDKKE